MSLELDHVWFMVTKDSQEFDLLEKHGFQVSKQGNHPGLGTASRSVLFNENYLELQFIINAEEAAQTPLKLVDRAKWKEKSICPFGIGLRGKIADSDLSKYWEFKPKELKGLTIYVHKSNEEDPTLPLLFVCEPPEWVKSGQTGPKNWPGLNPEVLRHKWRTDGIKSLVIEGPCSGEYGLSEVIPRVNFKKGTDYRMTLKMAGDLKHPIELNPFLELVP